MLIERLGYDDARARALAELPDPSTLSPARVVAVHRGRCAVLGADIDALLPLSGTLTASASQPSDLPTVGDWVAVAHREVIRHVLPRTSLLARSDGDRPGGGGHEALAANAERCLVLTSLDHDLNARRLERFVTLARAGGLLPLVVCTKGDRSADPIGEAARLSERLGGVEALVLSAVDGWGITALRSRLAPGTTSVLVGMSGVGKSTLVNLLLGEERQRTLEVRASDDRGRHATTHRELFVLDDGAMVIDLPGVRLPRLTTDAGLDDTFSDVTALARGCRFADCAHGSEPGCAVQAAIADGTLAADRLRAMRKLEREGMSAAERQARSRRIHRDYRRVVAARPRRDR